MIVEAAESRCRVCLCVCTDEEHALTEAQADALKLDALTALVCFDCWRGVSAGAMPSTVTRAEVVPCGAGLDAHVTPVPGCTQGRVVATLRERATGRMAHRLAFGEGATTDEAIARAVGGGEQAALHVLAEACGLDVIAWVLATCGEQRVTVADEVVS